MHHVLWSSGWDSTFRVADLVLTHRRAVRPHYMADPSRLSTEIELRTIDQLRNAIAEKGGDAGSRLFPVEVHDRLDLAADADIIARLQQLRQLRHVGPQYEFLIPLARGIDTGRLELCIDRGDRTHHWFSFLEPDLARDPAPPPDDTYRIVDEPSNPDLAAFGCFDFPVLDVTKLQMAERADVGGFRDVMEMTWFCRRPTRRGEPCGICGPCRDAREEGLGRRVPEVSEPRRLARSFDHRARRYARRARRELRSLAGSRGTPR